MINRRFRLLIILVYIFSRWAIKSLNLFVEIIEGTQMAFLNCMLYLLVKNKKVKVPQEMKDVLIHYTPKTVKKICGVNKARIKKAYKMIAKSKKFVLTYGMGMTQHSYGTSNVLSATNLVIAKNGKIISRVGEDELHSLLLKEILKLRRISGKW